MQSLAHCYSSIFVTKGHEAADSHQDTILVLRQSLSTHLLERDPAQLLRLINLASRRFLTDLEQRVSHSAEHHQKVLGMVIIHNIVVPKGRSPIADLTQCVNRVLPRGRMRLVTGDSSLPNVWQKILKLFDMYSRRALSAAQPTESPEGTDAIAISCRSQMLSDVVYAVCRSPALAEGNQDVRTD